MKILKKRSKWVLAASSLLLLGACSNSPEASVEKLYDSAGEMTSSLNHLQVGEDKLQEAFDHDIAADESLKTLSQRGSETQQNLAYREKNYEQLKAAFDDFSQSMQALEEGKNSSDEAAYAHTDVAEPAQTVIDNLSAYLDSYRQMLDKETDYYQSLKSEDANFETFQGGMKEINQFHSQAQDKLKASEDALEALNQLSEQRKEADNGK